MSTTPHHDQATTSLIAAYRYPELHPPAERWKEEISARLSFNTSLKMGGNYAEYSITRLPGGPRSVSTQLKVGNTFMLCDCHDMTLLPRAYRLHFLDGYSINDPELKATRMEFVQRAILRVDRQMKLQGALSSVTIEHGLYKGLLPQGDLAIFSTGQINERTWLIKLGATTQFPGAKGELFIGWKQLVHLCKSGKFCQVWHEVAREDPKTIAGF